MSAGDTASFEPRVLAFCCIYCAYAAADVAGVTNRSYPESVRVVRVPCTGRIGETDLISAFESGVDGVLVMGCLDGQCNYKTGNVMAKKVVRSVKTLLDSTGLGSGRLEYHMVSASMGRQFADIVTEAVGRFKAIGPSPLGVPAQHEPQAALPADADRR